MMIKRQFIAGAVCNQCGQQDKIQRLEDDQRVWMECIACGMSKSLDEPSAPQSAVEEKPTGDKPVRFIP